MQDLINENIKNYEDAIFSITKEKQLLERRLTKLDPESMSFSNRVANIVRDLPVIDFIDPYYDVKQVVVNDLKEDLVYMGMPKVDRCMTCHVGIDKKGFEDQPQPYTTHPRLDEFVGGSSPHPMIEYGCTTCHAGRGRGTDFISSGHMPKNDTQAKEWKEKYKIALSIKDPNASFILKRLIFDEIMSNFLIKNYSLISIEKIFIENRIYRDIEDKTSWESVLSTIGEGLKPYVKKLKKDISLELNFFLEIL